MAIQIKSLTIGPPVKDTSQPVPSNDPNYIFNTIPTANDYYDLYVAPNIPANTATNTAQSIKSAIVRNIRLINTHTAAVTVDLYLNRPLNSLNRRRQLTPVGMVLAAGYLYIDNEEITLEPGDKIQGKASVGSVIQYVISGVERDNS